MTDEAPTESTESTAAPTLPPEPATPETAPGPKRPQPPSVTASAVILLVFGTLSAFASAGVVLWSLVAMSRFAGGFGGFHGGFGGGFGGDPMRGFDGGPGWMGVAMFAVLVLVGVAVSGGHLAAGWAILNRLAWGRILGMVVSGVAIVVVVMSVVSTLIWVGTLPDFSEFDRGGGRGIWLEWFRSLLTAGTAFGTIVSIVVGVAYAYILVALAGHEEAFD